MTSSTEVHGRIADTDRASTGSTPVRSRLTWGSGVWEGGGVFVVVTGMSFLQGGYFPTEWGWATLAVLWAMVLSLLLRERLGPGRLGLVALGAIGGLAGWTAASIAWSSSPARSILEVQRVFLYLAAAAVLLMVGRRRSVPSLVGGLLAAITVVCTYALATRLVPGWGSYDSLSNYRLSEPLGYWNALGIFAGIGVVLALGVAARARVIAVRALAAAASVPLAATWYFTFSRGAWMAMGVGIVAWLVLDPRRLQALAAIVAAAAPAAVGVLLASRADALTTVGAAEGDAAHQGKVLLLALIGLAALAAALELALAWAERRIEIGARGQRIANWALAGCAVVALGAGIAAGGGPAAIARDGYHRFTAPTTQTGPDLGARLLDLSSNGRVDLWKVAWHDFARHPLNGSGAGTYEETWLQNRPVPLKVRDAHSLYLETLAELGVPGLVLLLTFVGVALAAAIMSRASPLVPPVAGAFVAFLVHAGADWDWEIIALTLAGLVLACALLASRVGDEDGWRVRTVHRAIAVPAIVVVAAMAAVAMLGNSAIESGNDAIARSQWAAAASDGRSAMRFAPWSPHGWQILGRAQIGEGHLADAQRTLRIALAKEPRDWELWLDLSEASDGAERLRAFRRAERLNPRGREVAAFRANFIAG